MLQRSDRRAWRVLQETGDLRWDLELGVRTTNWPANTLGEALPALLAALARDVGSTAVVDLDMTGGRQPVSRCMQRRFM